MAEKHTYGQILKSSALIGGSSLVNVAIGVVRTKVMAILLGPSGVGMMGLYGAILELTVNIAGMGINSSGVRQIAEAAGSGEAERVARTAVVLRRISIFLGLIGAAFLLGFSRFVSTLTFGSDQYAPAVALLSIALFFNLVSAGQGALLQGMRRISDMARMGIWGTLGGALISIGVVYLFREEGLVLSLVLPAAMSLAISWWYSRKIHLHMPRISAVQIGHEAAAMLRLGFAFMACGLLMSGAAYAVRLIVVRKVGFDAAGLYQSAWALGGLYIGFILQAMGADFYPRLTAIAKDNAECNRVVNEQAHVSLLLAGPGVIGTLTFAPLVIAIFYTPKFEGAVEILRWLCLGMTLRVISWPMGYIIVVKGVQNLLIFSEVAWTAVYLGLAWTGVNAFGLKGAGIAFFGSYVFHVLMIYVMVRKLSGFRWSTENLQTSFLFLALITAVFCGYYALPAWLAMGVGTLAVLLSGLYSLQVLLDLVSPDRLPGPILRLLKGFKLIDAGSYGYEDAEAPCVKITVAGAALVNKPLTGLKRLIFAIMICTAFSLWAHWYKEVYGWSGEWKSLGLEVETLLPALPDRLKHWTGG
ncbi:O-antigen translocase [Methylomicrobium agile]|uniref:O-antigen translocase n=1 Tax=Methylomicrobium agile TaxID=39774 RepID=UPI000568A523|nr:O-antigen translocase [Methylomicrobium agile]